MGTAWLVTSAGVSLALGAFLAGMVVAGSEYRHQAMAELIPFREVLTSLFFVSIGMLLDPSILWRNPGLVVFLLFAILVGKFVIVFLTAALMRLPLRVCVLAAAALAQVGEFSFVLMRAATGTTLVQPALAESLMLAVILSMLVTPLAIAAGPKLAAGAGKIRPLTRLLEVKTAEEAESRSRAWKDHVIIAGFGIAGQELARALRECSIEYVIADLNPDNIREAARAGEPVYFGDVTSAEVLAHLGAARAREVVLVINDPNAAERAVKAVRHVAPGAYVLVRSRYLADVEPLLSAGANEVVPAEIEAATEVAARVLSRHEVSEELVEGQLDRIRARRSEHSPGGSSVGDAPP
jgi:CPA2 family monovalent cation:H+ antiporter-2